MSKWICSICGYVYDEAKEGVPFQDLPETWVCPLCGAGKAAFRPEETEKALMAAFDEKLWSHLHHLLIFHGRYVCHAKKPDCGACELKNHCEYYKNSQKV